MSQDSRKSLRRSARIQARVKDRKVATYSSSSEDEDCKSVALHVMKKELTNIEENVQKPVELFSNDDVSGETLFKLNTPIKKNSMIEKAYSCRTPGNTKENKLLSPIVLLEKIDLDSKQVLNSHKANPISKVSRKMVRFEMNLSESESISEPSDYIPSADESEDESEDRSSNTDNTDSTNDEGETVVKTQRHRFIAQSNLLNSPRRVNKKNKPAIIHNDFHMQSDAYFATQAEKVVTSDRTLEHLHNSRLTKEKLEQLLSNQNSTTMRHKKNISSLTTSYTALFPMWYFIMEQGYTVLLYGVGSKRCLINDFHKSISNHPTLVINGFFPSLTIKDIVDGIIVDLLEMDCPSNTGECVNIIEKALKKNPKNRLYLLVHNIDGIMLRSNKAQELLSCLASIPNLCILASVDHINAPLLWDHTKHSKFKFFWWDTTTFFPYQAETSYESSLLVQKSGALALSSLHNVFLSLTSNAKAIYILLAKNQLSNSGDINFAGMAFKDLYRAAREGFLVSSDIALRAQLTEFIDHKLVKTKRNIDSVEHLIIPLSDALLKQFLEEHDT